MKDFQYNGMAATQKHFHTTSNIEARWQHCADQQKCVFIAQ
jgi:hypothetical protein